MGELTPDQSCDWGAEVQTLENEINYFLCFHFLNGLPPLNSAEDVGFSWLGAMDLVLMGGMKNTQINNYYSPADTKLLYRTLLL